MGGRRKGDNGRIGGFLLLCLTYYLRLTLPRSNQPPFLPPHIIKVSEKEEEERGGTMVVAVAEAAGRKREKGKRRRESISGRRRRGFDEYKSKLNHHKWHSRKKWKNKYIRFFLKNVKYVGIPCNVRIPILQRKALGCCVSLARGGKGMLPPPSSFDP